MTLPPDYLHNYSDDEFFERVTPIDEIPDEFRMLTKLPNGNSQIIDTRRAYNWNPLVGFMVECGSVAGDDFYES